MLAREMNRSRSRNPSAPYLDSITIEISTKLATDILVESAASIASRKLRRSDSRCRIASTAEVSITISVAGRPDHIPGSLQPACHRAPANSRSDRRFPLIHPPDAALYVPVVLA